MRSVNWGRCWMPSCSRARRHPSGVASICAPTQAIPAPAPGVIQAHGYIPHVKGRGQEVRDKRRDPTKKARQWVVEVAHGWFNRFRKLFVRYEKPERSFLELNHLAAAIIAYRKIPLAVDVIYGQVLNHPAI